MNQRIFPITMPRWGIEMQQGTITQWHAAQGQAIARGDALLDVETEKIVNSVEAPVDGTLRRVLAEVGSTQVVGTLIAVFADISIPDAEIDAFVAGFSSDDTVAAPDASAVAAAATTAAGSAPAGPNDDAPRVSPIARRLAERLGVDIAKIKGTGSLGRVSKEDVEAYAAAMQGVATPSPAVSPAPVQAISALSNAPTREKMSSRRATIARRLLESKQSIPHYRLVVNVDLTALLARRSDLNAAGSAKVSVNDLLLRAAALALVRHPCVNAQLQGDEMLKFPHADISVAVATEAGLVTPIVRVADTKSTTEIASEVADLSERARAGRLTREEITGGTFTLSNLGMFGVDSFDAIINPPQVAILAVGAGADRVVPRDGHAEIAKVATLTLSCDHRVVDGASAAQFLATLRELVEKPTSL